MKKLIALVIALGLVVAACGGSTDVLGGDETVAGDDAAPADDGSSEEESSDDGSSDDGSSEEESSDGGSGGDFCALAAEREAQETAFESLDFFDPVALEMAFNENRDLLAEVVEAAPSEIRSDLEIIREDYERVYQLFADNNFDASLLLQADLDFEDSPEAEAAGMRLDEYIRNTCGIDPDANEDGGPTGEELVEQSGQSDELVRDALLQLGFSEAEATCLAESIAFEEFVALSEGEVPDAILQRFTDCGVSLEELAELGGADPDSMSDDLGEQLGDLPPEGVEIVIEELVRQGFTEDEAVCLAQSLVAPETAGDIFAALESCNIPLERLQDLSG